RQVGGPKSAAASESAPATAGAAAAAVPAPEEPAAGGRSATSASAAPPSGRPAAEEEQQQARAAAAAEQQQHSREENEAAFQPGWQEASGTRGSGRKSSASTSGGGGGSKAEDKRGAFQAWLIRKRQQRSSAPSGGGARRAETDRRRDAAAERDGVSFERWLEAKRAQLRREARPAAAAADVEEDPPPEARSTRRRGCRVQTHSGAGCKRKESSGRRSEEKLERQRRASLAWRCAAHASRRPWPARCLAANSYRAALTIFKHLAAGFDENYKVFSEFTGSLQGHRREACSPSATSTVDRRLVPEAPAPKAFRCLALTSSCGAAEAAVLAEAVTGEAEQSVWLAGPPRTSSAPPPLRYVYKADWSSPGLHAPSSRAVGNHLSAVAHLARAPGPVVLGLSRPSLRPAPPCQPVPAVQPALPGSSDRLSEGHATRCFAARFNADGLLLTSAAYDCVKFGDLRLASGDPQAPVGPHICCPDGSSIVKRDACSLGATVSQESADFGDSQSSYLCRLGSHSFGTHGQCEAPPSQLASRTASTAPGHPYNPPWPRPVALFSRAKLSWPAAVTARRRRALSRPAGAGLGGVQHGAVTAFCCKAPPSRRHPLEENCSVLGYADDLALLSSDCAEAPNALLDGLTAAGARGSVSVFNAMKTEGCRRCGCMIYAEIRLRDGDGPGRRSEVLQFVYLGGLAADICDVPSETAARQWPGACLRSMRALLALEALSDGARSQLLFQARC
uniref:WD_REPEATS_REGION domain-containing protein n=1 Tax=Macrostomum lignano TaxID=282301 RepID=A0A1I8JPK1_9PLAT